MRTLLEDIKRTATQVWVWVKSLPIIKPLYLLLYSRKAVISGALVYFLLEHFPKLAPVENELAVLITQVVAIALLALANVLGVAIEDAAAKGAAGSPPAHLAG